MCVVGRGTVGAGFGSLDSAHEATSSADHGLLETCSVCWTHAPRRSSGHLPGHAGLSVAARRWLLVRGKSLKTRYLWFMMDKRRVDLNESGMKIDTLNFTKI